MAVKTTAPDAPAFRRRPTLLRTVQAAARTVRAVRATPTQAGLIAGSGCWFGPQRPGPQ
ncbi:MAG: hypothetical protein LBH06_05190 [Rikenellaceae bacterium]|nr:hypothetical protein [Rikenellaceae bacterium]